MLSQLTAAGRADVLTGYVLSPFPLWAIGELEDALARRHVRQAAAAGAGDAALAQRLVRLAMDDVGGGAFVYGSRQFRLASMATAAAPLLLHLSLRVKHPQVTLEEAVTLLNAAPDPYAVVLALWDFLGYARPAPKARPRRPIDWPAIYRTLLAGVPGKRPPMTREQIATLTVPQLLHALEVEPPTPDAITPAGIERLRQRKQDETFDAIARRYGLAPDDLAAKPAEELERLVREFNGGRPIATEHLTGWARGYADRRKEGPR